ncbi:unnamed protein product [Brugia timori]|uniref:Ricin B-type lectin domain-containing protein n=1 Tax=Brugia timori TaxID=42155 RepID=A0A0R3QDE6_9BILA|nr:unnamed protein product [Brugia timori]
MLEDMQLGHHQVSPCTMCPDPYLMVITNECQNETFDAEKQMWKLIPENKKFLSEKRKVNEPVGKK